jgi:hypothetical protein
MINKTKLFKSLNFNGNKNSWFDLWHIHSDFEGKGNKNWESRKKYIYELFDLFNDCKLRLKSYPHEFQLFIFILEQDSSHDAVYIHTKNPNQNNFPLKISSEISIKIKDEKLYKYLKTFKLSILESIYENEVQYFLFDHNFGIPLSEIT